MKTIMRYAFLPLMFLIAAYALWLVESGSNHWWLLALFGIAVLTSFLAEQFVPYDPRFNSDMGDRGRDFAHAFVNEASNLLSVFSIPALVALLGSGGLWPSHLPFWVQCLGATLFADIGITFAHYASHKWSWLWKFHAVHHSVRRLYGFNGLMKHPIHQAIEGMVGVAPLVALVCRWT